MSTAIVPVGDLERMAQAVAASKLFGMQTKEQALALMLVAQAEGLHPATAARDYHIIQGRPAMKADAMLARYLNSGGRIEWHEHTDSSVAATFSHPAGGTLKVDWNMERARKAGLGGKDNWTKYPRQMLRARVISEGVRATNPAVAVGVYTVEETQDFDAKAPRKERDMGKVEVVEPEADEDITQRIPESAAPQVPSSQSSAPLTPAPAEPAVLLSADQVIVLEDAFKASKRDPAKLLANVSKRYKVPIHFLRQIKAADFADALAYAEGA